MPSKRTMLVTEPSENPLLTDEFALNIVETSAQPGEILATEYVSPFSELIHAYSHSMDAPPPKNNNWKSNCLRKRLLYSQKFSVFV